MSSDFVNGDRSPIPPDKQTQNPEISSSASRLEQLNGVKDGSRVHSNDNKQVNGGNDGSRGVESQHVRVDTQLSWKQLLEAERQAEHGRLIQPHVHPENVGTSSSLRDKSHFVGNQSNQENQSPTNSNQVLNAKEKLGIASQILGISSQNLGVLPISGNPSLIVGGNVQIQAGNPNLQVSSNFHGNLDLRRTGDNGVQNIQGSYSGVHQEEQPMQNDEGRFDTMFPTIHQGNEILNQRRRDDRHQQTASHVSVEQTNRTETHRKEATLSDGQTLHSSLNQQNQTWSHIFSTEKNRYALQKTNMIKSNDKFFIPRDVIERGSVQWKQVIVGFFFDAGFGFRYVERFLRNKWRLKGSLKINADKKFFYLRFSSDEDRKQVLEGGPFFINGKVFVLREWNANIEVEKMSCKSLPIWARFWDIPKFLWNSEGFSNLASCIGTPLFTDRKTMEWERMGYARLCIEVDTSFDFPDKLHFESELLEFSIDVEYQWIPIKCRNCSCFGHHFHQCNIPTKMDKENNTNEGNEEGVLPRDKNQNQVTEHLVSMTREDVTVLGSEQDEQHKEMSEKEIEITLESGTTKQAEPTMEGVVQELVQEIVIEEKNKDTNVQLDDVSIDEVNSNKENEHQESNAQSNKNKEGVTKKGTTNERQDQNKETEKTKAPRKILGRNEVTHIQKDRNIRERTRSGVAANQGMVFSQSNIEYEEYDEDGASEADEVGIEFENDTPRILRNYIDKGIDKHKKASGQNNSNYKVKRGGQRNRYR